MVEVRRRRRLVRRVRQVALAGLVLQAGGCMIPPYFNNVLVSGLLRTGFIDLFRALFS